MNDRIEAIYENGVFRPLGEVSLPDHLRVVLRIEDQDIPEADAEVVARQKRAAALLDAKLADIPYNHPNDGLSSEDHDRILYGGKL
jgi:predicted DNA-binding antitoxin AbrB/MazE fold protein